MASATMATMEVSPARRIGGFPAWAGAIGALLMAASTILVFLTPPDSRGANGVARTAAFYARHSNVVRLIVGEPLSLIAALLLVWYLARLAAVVRSVEAGQGRSDTLMLGGGLLFVSLFLASLAVQTTGAGAILFSPSIKLDANIAVLLSHLGYVLMGGALMGATVLIPTIGRMSSHVSTLPRWFGWVSYVLAAICLLGYVVAAFVPVVLFALWLIGVSVAFAGHHQ
ncbi:MAG: hypothetical protein ACYDCC_15775 [Actinomycetota bacterium]